MLAPCNHFSEISQFWTYIKNCLVKVFHSNFRHGQPIYLSYFTKIFYHLINFISDIPIQENVSDFRGFSSKVLFTTSNISIILYNTTYSCISHSGIVFIYGFLFFICIDFVLPLSQAVKTLFAVPHCTPASRPVSAPTS